MEQKSNGFNNVQDIVKFISGNPQRFLEQVNQNPELRANFSSILKTANPSEIISMAYELQDERMKVVHPITGVKTIIEPFSQRVAQWMDFERKQLNENPYYHLESPKEKFDFFKLMEEDEEMLKLSKIKKQEIIRHVLEGKKITDELIHLAFEGYAKMTQVEMKRYHDLQKLIENGDFDKITNEQMAAGAKYVLGVENAVFVGETKAEQVLSMSKAGLSKSLIFEMKNPQTAGLVIERIDKIDSELAMQLRYIHEGHDSRYSTHEERVIAMVNLTISTVDNKQHKNLEKYDNNENKATQETIMQVGRIMGINGAANIRELNKDDEHREIVNKVLQTSGLITATSQLVQIQKHNEEIRNNIKNHEYAPDLSVIINHNKSIENNQQINVDNANIISEQKLNGNKLQ